MIITQTDHVSIVHRDISITIEGYVKLLYEDNGLTVVVDSIPEMFFNNISISDIKSNITIEV